MNNFKLTEKEEKEIKEWQEQIKKVYGQYGTYDYIFTPCEIGVGVKVRSHIAGIERDFTDVDSW